MRGNALFSAKFSYKIMVTRGVTLGNIMQHGLKIKISHAKKKEHKIYFQMNPNLIYFGWSGGFKARVELCYHALPNALPNMLP